MPRNTNPRKKNNSKGIGSIHKRQATGTGLSGYTAGTYAGYGGPRVGGPAPKSIAPLKGASKSQVKAAKKMVRPGTGSGASAAARRSANRKRLY
jgi:hypothetical protein